MSLSYREKQRITEYLRSLTDTDDVLACMDALTEALGAKALSTAAAYGYQERHYLRDKSAPNKLNALEAVWFYAQAENAVNGLLSLWDTGGEVAL